MKALLVNDASLAGHHGSCLVTEQIKALACRTGIVVTTGWDWESILAIFQDQPKLFDIVIVNGEGSIHDNSKAARRISSLAPELAAKGVPAYLVNATIGGCSAHVLHGLGAYRARFVRDSASQAELALAGLNSEVVADLVLTATIAPQLKKTIEPLLLTDLSDEAKTARLIGLKQRWHGSTIITFRSPPPRPVRGSSTRALTYGFKRAIASTATLSPWSLRYAGALQTREKLVDIFTSCSGLIAARYHAVCLALILRVPFLALESNTGKTGALLRDVGLQARCVDFDLLESGCSPPVVPAFNDRELAAIEYFLSKTSTAATAMFTSIAADAVETAKVQADWINVSAA